VKVPTVTGLGLPPNRIAFLERLERFKRFEEFERIERSQRTRPDEPGHSTLSTKVELPSRNKNSLLNGMSTNNIEAPPQVQRSKRLEK